MLLSGLSKTFVLLLSFIVVLSLLLVESCVAPVTTPSNPSSAPEISVVIHNSPEWVPPVYTTNTYTGEVKESTPGYWRASGTIEVTIKNRPFTPYTDKNGNYINVYYSFFLKITNSIVTWDDVSRPSYAVYQSDVDYTVVTFPYGGKITSAPEHLWSLNRPGESFDFRVQAVTGYFHGASPFVDPVFEGEGSEWVEFRVTIPDPDNPSTSTPIFPSNPSGTSTFNPNNSQSAPQHDPSLFDIVVVRVLIALCIIAILMAITAYLFKQGKTKSMGTVDGVGCEMKTEMSE